MTDHRKHFAQSTGEPPEHWPTGILPISLDGLGYLGVGPDGQIYWDGKPIEVRKSFTLTWYQRLGAILVTLSALIAAIAAGVSAYADLEMLRCSLHT